MALRSPTAGTAGRRGGGETDDGLGRGGWGDPWRGRGGAEGRRGAAGGRSGRRAELEKIGKSMGCNYKSVGYFYSLGPQAKQPQTCAAATPRNAGAYCAVGEAASGGKPMVVEGRLPFLEAGV